MTMRAAVRGLRQLVDALLVLSLAIISAVLVLQVFMRYVLNAALPWPEELAQFLLVALSMFGSYRAIELDQHIRLEAGPAIARGLPLRLARSTAVLVTMAFVLYLAWGGVGLSKAAWNLPSTALRVPMGWVYVIIPVTCLLMAAALVVVFARQLRGGAAPPPS
jgi:TRAP-type C4-dicarboxylate transport system permease small subunit